MVSCCFLACDRSGVIIKNTPEDGNPLGMTGVWQIDPLVNAFEEMEPLWLQSQIGYFLSLLTLSLPLGLESVRQQERCLDICCRHGELETCTSTDPLQTTRHGIS